MTDEELAAATLAMMGYTPEECPMAGIPGRWTVGRWVKPGYLDRFAERCFGGPLQHYFAVEVKQHMMGADWDCDDDAFSRGEDGCEGYISFRQVIRHPDDDDFEREIEGVATYHNMEQHPRAVCEAALRAIAAEREAENDT